MTKIAHVVFVVLFVTAIITAANWGNFAPSVLAKNRN